MTTNSLATFARSFIYKKEMLLAEQFMYGNREVLVKALNLDEDIIFLARLQHGWITKPDLSEKYWNEKFYGRTLKKYPHLVWSKQLAIDLRERLKRPVKAIGSPWSLLSEARKKRSLQTTNLHTVKDSVLYFPYHSYPGIESNIEQKETIRLLKGLGASRITTCLYWLDFIDPSTYRVYEEFSTVVCCGYRGSSAQEAPWSDDGGRINFLYELSSQIEQHELIVCDDVSTAFAAACSRGKKVMIGARHVKSIPRGHTGIEKILIKDNLLQLKEQFSLQETPLKGQIMESSGHLEQIAREGFGFDIPISQTTETLKDLSWKSKILAANMKKTGPT